jgi:hypothetical protein
MASSVAGRSRAREGAWRCGWQANGLGGKSGPRQDKFHDCPVEQLLRAVVGEGWGWGWGWGVGTCQRWRWFGLGLGLGPLAVAFALLQPPQQPQQPRKAGRGQAGRDNPR